jgi:predicted ArsR family transcriptional regulator
MWDRHGVDTLDLLLHPVRMRIVHLMAGDRTRTTADLIAGLPDVPKTTIYRHVALLVDGGVLEVADEQRVHGAVERHYRLRQDRTRIEPEAGASMSLDEHRQGFTAAMAALLAEFNAYLDRDGADPYADQVGYRQGVLWLSKAEMAEMADEFQAIVLARAANKPAPGRAPRILSAIFFPAGPSELAGAV